MENKAFKERKQAEQERRSRECAERKQKEEIDQLPSADDADFKFWAEYLAFGDEILERAETNKTPPQPLAIEIDHIAPRIISAVTEPIKKGKMLQIFTIPCGSICKITRKEKINWQEYETKIDLEFDRFERYESESQEYDFSHKGWLIQVYRKNVKHSMRLVALSNN